MGLLAQGLQRKLDSEGRVSAPPKPSETLLNALSSNVVVFLSDVETDLWPAGAISAVANRSGGVIITRGSSGAHEHLPGVASPVHSPAYDVPQVLDTNGAGDSFAVGYIVAAARGHRSPMAVANWAGAMAVSQPQTCKPQCIADGIRAQKEAIFS